MIDCKTEVPAHGPFSAHPCTWPAKANGYCLVHHPRKLLQSANSRVASLEKQLHYARVHAAQLRIRCIDEGIPLEEAQ